MNPHSFSRTWREHARSPQLARVLRSEKGMTLIEVMVVIVIILTLMGVLAFGVFSMLGDAQADTSRLMVTKTAQNIEIQMLRGKKPKSGGLAELFPGEVPKDAWGNELRLVVPGGNGKKFDLISYGADGQEGGQGADADIKYSEL